MSRSLGLREDQREGEMLVALIAGLFVGATEPRRPGRFRQAKQTAEKRQTLPA